MCLGVPACVLSVSEGVVRSGRADFGGVIREVNLAYVPEVQVGDWVIVHVGFAISRLDEDEARRTFELLSEIAPEIRVPEHLQRAASVQ